MEKTCGSCKFYDPLKGEPPAGYCRFVEFNTLPSWMDTVKTLTILRRLPGSDVLSTEGTQCDAFQLSK